MAVTTTDYSITAATPQNIIDALESAFSDLGWHTAEQPGYLLTFTSTAGSVVYANRNKRYLVEQSSTTGSGANAVFDILRNNFGGVLTTTLVNGGRNYNIIGMRGNTNAGNVLTVDSTTGLAAGMIVTKTYGTGTIPANTAIVSITNSTDLVLDQTPTVALSGGAGLQFADTITIDSSKIGGSSYTNKANQAVVAGASTIYVESTNANWKNIQIGQRVSGHNIGAYTAVSSITSNAVGLTKSTLGQITDQTLTFSDDIVITCGTLANKTGLRGNVGPSSTSIIVHTNNNIYPGSKVVIDTAAGLTVDDTTSNVIVQSVTGSGPFVVALKNRANTFRGFTTTTGSNVEITFKASQGNASSFFAEDRYAYPSVNAYGVLRTTNANKRLGNTFYSFYAVAQSAAHQPVGGVAPVLYIRSGAGFNPSSNSFQGVAELDIHQEIAITPVPAAAAVSSTLSYNAIINPVASSTQVPVTLRVRKSGLDSNFAVFSFIEGNNSRINFIMAKYNNSIQPWNLDDVFLGGVYELFVSNGTAIATNDTALTLRTRMSGLPKRQAEAGYTNYSASNVAVYTNVSYRSTSGARQTTQTGTPAYDQILTYVRQDGDIHNGVANNAIYKNIPITPAFAPVPYYIPADFVLAEIPFGEGIMGDTLTVTAGSEVYTVIQRAVNTVTGTTLALCARTT